MYDPKKENDKEVLKEQQNHLIDEVLELRRIVNQLTKEKDQADTINQKLSEELQIIRERVFNSKQERKANTPKYKKRKNGKLPHNQSKNKPVDEQEIELDEQIIPYTLNDNNCPKCGGDKFLEMNNCFEESSEIEVIERKYIVKRHKRQKYSCKCCNQIITAPGGVKLTPGGEYSIQLASQIACDKFEDHIPLERQRKQMHRAGIRVEVKTLYGLTEHLYNRLYPLNELIRQDVLSEQWVHIDESPMNFYNPKKSNGYIWSLSNANGAFYQFEPTRSGAVAREMLKGYKTGNVVTDGFSGYDFLHDKNNEEFKNINHAYCWAHVRRKFFEAMKHDKRAEDIVDLIDDLYEVEHMADEVHQLIDIRHNNSKPIVTKIDEWIQSMDGKYLSTSSLGKAINYYLGRKDGLHLFLANQFVPIDNNMAERKQRCPVMGRKNFLHFKSINGADVGAFFYSVIESCKSNGLNARAFINEMAHRSANGQELESPFSYSNRLTNEINLKLSEELQGKLKRSD